MFFYYNGFPGALPFTYRLQRFRFWGIIDFLLYYLEALHRARGLVYGFYESQMIPRKMYFFPDFTTLPVAIPSSDVDFFSGCRCPSVLHKGKKPASLHPVCFF